MMPADLAPEKGSDISSSSTAQGSNPGTILPPPSLGEIGRALRKVLDDACCGNLWRSELTFIRNNIYNATHNFFCRLTSALRKGHGESHEPSHQGKWRFAAGT